MVFVFVEFQHGGERSGVRLGKMRKASACTDKAPTCLPQLTMVDMAGRAWPPEALADKIVVVNVWATWCKPCEEEIPDLVAVQRRYADRGVVLLGLLNDSAEDRVVERFVRTHGVNYPVVRLDEDLYQAFDQPDTLPTTFLYDRSGHLRFGQPGFMSEKRLSRMLDELLAE
jgi:thiol-disulfide isomerase/thioredoxin